MCTKSATCRTQHVRLAAEIVVIQANNGSDIKCSLMHQAIIRCCAANIDWLPLPLYSMQLQCNGRIDAIIFRHKVITWSQLYKGAQSRDAGAGLGPFSVGVLSNWVQNPSEKRRGLCGCLGPEILKMAVGLTAETSNEQNHRT